MAAQQINGRNSMGFLTMFKPLIKLFKLKPKMDFKEQISLRQTMLVMMHGAPISCLFESGFIMRNNPTYVERKDSPKGHVMHKDSPNIFKRGIIDVHNNVTVFNKEEAVKWFEVEKVLPGGIIILKAQISKEKPDLLNSIYDWVRSLNFEKTIGFTVGNLLNGRYVSKTISGSFYSISAGLEIVGVSSDALKDIANSLRGAFNQDAVLVKDHSTGKVGYIKNDLPNKYEPD